MDLKGWDVAEMRPDSETEVAEDNRLVVLDEKRLAGRGPRGDQILRSQDVCVGDVGHIRDIPQICTIAQHKGSLPLGDAIVNGRQEVRVPRATEHRGSEGTSCHCAAVGFKNHFLSCGLITLC